MKNDFLPQFIFFLAPLMFLAAACSHQHHASHGAETESPHNDHHQPAAMHPEKSSSEMEALFWERRQEARMQFTSADVDFMHGMIPHHAQALIMSRLAPENGANAAVQRLAARIINAQNDEIRSMQTWLRDREQPVPIVHIDGLYLHITMEQPKKADDAHAGHTMAGHAGHAMPQTPAMQNGHASMHDHHDMPGMLTQEQLYELGEARGSRFDYLFLKYMIDHHAGAVYMVEELFKADGAGTDREMYRLASDIYTEQITEIDMMRLMLAQIPTEHETKSQPHHQHHD